MLVRSSTRYRIYPTPSQEAQLLSWEGALRFLWNLAHEQRLMGLARTERRYPTGFQQMRELTQLRAEHSWLAEVPRDVCEWLLSNLDSAWRRCFGRLGGRPRWKRKGESVSFVESHSDAWALGENFVRFPKVGAIRAVVHRRPLGKVKICTITRDGDQWFASVMSEAEASTPTPRTEPVVAIDRGITYTLADSDGNLTPNPKHYDKAAKRLARAQRALCRRKKGSKNREKAKLRVMRLNRKVRRQREHFLHVESSRLAKSHGVVVIEKLNVKGLARGACGRSVANAGWSSFEWKLRYKLSRSGGSLVTVPAAYSSQTCSACGNVDARSRRGERFCCVACCHTAHADLNAALVLKTRANRSGLPVEGSVPKAARRNRKGEREKVALAKNHAPSVMDYAASDQVSGDSTNQEEHRNV
jgi:putative transposase